jgi:hypothetical protein
MLDIQRKDAALFLHVRAQSLERRIGEAKVDIILVWKEKL